MQTQAIALNNLHVSPLNVRAEKKEPSLKKMAAIAANILPTVREKGILSDLIVRQDNAGFEILAGRRRYYAAKVIENERGDFPPLPCDVRENLTDADAREISLIENVAREDADEITCYEAFSALIHEGKTVDEIARTFGKTEREVCQSLAIANLLPRVRDLYRNEELDAGDLQLLTMATKTQQRDWLKLWEENDAPTGHGLKGWLFCGAAIAAKVALFDLATYSGKIVGDLFSEDGYFASADEFWTAQDEAIAARRDAYLAAKWSEVVVLERGAHFPQWGFVKASKKQGGRVYIEPTHTGEVRFHEGYITQAEANRDKKKAKAAIGEGEAPKDEPARSPVTKAMQNYLDLHRHGAVRLALLARPKDALRLLIAHAVAASGNWKVSPEARRADNDAVRESVAQSEAQILFEAEAKAVRKLLGPALDGEETAISSQGRGDDERTVKIFQRLLRLKDAQVGRIATFVMAETLAVGSAVIDAYGRQANVNPRHHWTPDATFFDLLRDRSAANAMLAEVAGKKVADRLVSAKLKDQRAALANAAKDTDWCPGWMRFPATGL
ncbi:MAG TPA: ParB N-terminal domain-containing protein [Rhizomicrobium sp.]|nr:ParB N-terminal domain-containing protein [Rhizomicrobium sp.]